MQFFKNYWIHLSIWSIKKIYKIIWLLSIGAFFIGLIAFYLYMNALPSLSIWHTKLLKNEFHIHSNVKNFTSYIRLEEKLFKELETEIYNKVLPKERNTINRYTTNSLSDPRRWDINWNKSFEMQVKEPKGAVLLLHGMSDSPYSLHHQATSLYKNGWYVLGVRLPGHGTIPSGLRNVTWEEMAAVVQLSMQHLKAKIGDKAIHIIGYSTGAPLALNYTLHALQESSTLTLPSSLIFYSPAIGVSKAAPLAVWQSRFGYILGLPKLEWNSLNPEYDPFKYNSFAVNAGDQVYRLSNEVQQQFDTFEKHPSKKTFPPVLSFASIVDSTVSIPAVIDKLYNRLPKGDHTLVLFDINHNFSQNHLIKKAKSTQIQALRDTPIHGNYTFELISNINTKNRTVEQIIHHKKVNPLPYQWAKGLYSLSHLAIPMSPNDPLYGSKNAPKSPGIQLGHLALYGETGVLQTSTDILLRQRWNPFYNYTNERVLVFLEGK